MLSIQIYYIHRLEIDISAIVMDVAYGYYRNLSARFSMLLHSGHFLHSIHITSMPIERRLLIFCMDEPLHTGRACESGTTMVSRTITLMAKNRDIGNIQRTEYMQ